MLLVVQNTEGTGQRVRLDINNGNGQDNRVSNSNIAMTRMAFANFLRVVPENQRGNRETDTPTNQVL